MIMSIELLGYLGGLIVAFSLLPQVIKSWRTKSTKDISLSWNSIYSIGLALWVIYGIITFNWPIIVMMDLELVMALPYLF